MRRKLILAIALAATLVAGTAPALADAAQPGVVSENPVDFTPQVEDGTVYGLALVGRTVVVGGDFRRVANADESQWYARRFLFAYDLFTGTVTGFAPQLNGIVDTLAPGPDNTVYAGGVFTGVNGVPQRGVTRLDVATGARVGGFGAGIDNGDVRTLAYSGGWLYVGGAFTRINGQPRAGLARLNAATGALDTGWDLHLTGAGGGAPKVDAISVSPDGSKLVALGVIQSAAGQPRAQLLMANTGNGTVAGWYTDAYAGPCYAAFDTYLRGVDFSPGGDYFVVVTTGRLSAPERMCDTAARFETAGGTGFHRPTWVNHTGGNSLYAVDVTGSAVYVGGHEQWLDNPYGHKFAGPGAVYRPGIGAIDPVSGKALGWNPTRTRGVGVEAFLSTPAGLIVGSDTVQLGHEYHARLGMFPLT